jgi:hypothetical protein
MIKICFNAHSSLITFVVSYCIAFYLLRRKNPKLKWAAVAIMGITLMQLFEGLLWFDGPTTGGTFNKILTMVFIPLGLLAQAWGPLLGSLFVTPLRKRPVGFFLLLTYAFIHVVLSRIINNPIYTQVTPGGGLNWFSQFNPPIVSPWAYALWALVIGAPFLLWWRPFCQALLIVTWGWFLATISYVITDSPASYWCFFITSYALFVLIWSFMLKDKSKAPKTKPNKLVTWLKRLPNI